MRRKVGALFASLALGFGVLALAGPAAAAELPYVEAHVEDCESAYLTLVNPRGYGVTFEYAKDAGDPVEVDVAAGDEQDVQLRFAVRSGDHTVAYRVTRSPERDDKEVAGSVQVDCLTDVTPAAPEAVDESCDEPGGIRITRTEGVRYKLDGVHIGKGFNELPPGTYPVIAHAREGYEIPAEAATSWTLTVTAATDCQTPGQDPSADPSGDPSDEPSPSASPEPNQSTGSARGGQAGGNLPLTGRSMGWLAWLVAGAVAALGSGAGFVWYFRRRVTL